MVTRNNHNPDERKAAGIRTVQQPRKLGRDTVQRRRAGRLGEVVVPEGQPRTYGPGMERAIQEQRGPQRSGQPHAVLVGDPGQVAQGSQAAPPGLNRAHNASRPTGRPRAEQDHVTAADPPIENRSLDLVGRHLDELLRPRRIQHREGIAAAYRPGHGVIQPRLIQLLNNRAGHLARTRSPTCSLFEVPPAAVIPG